jgi:hypothetical protein
LTVEMEEVVPGILHWKARHPKIGADVSSYLLTGSGTLLDPILPEGEGPGWIGHDIERAILTVRHHVRSTPELGVPVFVHSSGAYDLESEDVDVRTYEAGDEPAPGVQVLPFGRICDDDAVLRIALGPGVLAFGDGLMSYDGLGFVPDQYIGDDPQAVKADIVEGLVPLLEEDFDAMLFAHGEPVPSGGKQMLREFVDSRR